MTVVLSGPARVKFGIPVHELFVGETAPEKLLLDGREQLVVYYSYEGSETDTRPIAKVYYDADPSRSTHGKMLLKELVYHGHHGGVHEFSGIPAWVD